MSTEVEVKTSSSLKNNYELDHEKAIMLERICELQKKHAKKCEKMDFLEEHNQTLIEEMTKKNRCVKQYCFSYLSLYHLGSLFRFLPSLDSSTL